MPAIGRKKACNLYARLPGKAVGQGCRAKLHAMSQYAEQQIGRKYSILTNVPSTTRRTTTKQYLDPRCTYVQTRVKSAPVLSPKVL
jgi:hypothetical protein